MKFLKVETSTLIFVCLGLSVIFIPLFTIAIMFVRQGTDSVKVTVFDIERRDHSLTESIDIRLNRISFHPKTLLKRPSMWFTGSYERPGYIQFDGNFIFLQSSINLVETGLIKIDEEKFPLSKELIIENIQCDSDSPNVIIDSTQKFTARFNISSNKHFLKYIEDKTIPPLKFNLNINNFDKNCIQNQEFLKITKTIKSTTIEGENLYIFKPYKIYDFEENSYDNKWFEWISAPEYGELK